MQKKTIIIDVETDEGVKSLNRLEASFEDVYGEVQPLTGRLGELEDQLYEMANAGDTSSDAFKALSAEVGRMKKTVMEVDMQVDALSTTTGQKLGGAISGLAGGFELAQGAMGAFGVESAKVEEALLRVNSAMAIAQGVQSVRESIPAFKALNAVIMANPIAAVVTAFIALSTAAMAWASQVSTKVSDGFKKTADAAESYRKNLAKANEQQNKTTDKVLKALDQEAERRKAMGEDAVKVQRQINEQKIKELEIAIERDRSEIRSLNNQKENLKLAQEKAKLEIASQVREESKNLANAAFDWQRTKALNRIANLGEELNKIDKEGSEQISSINQQLKDRIGELESQKDAVESLKNEQIALNREQGEKAAEAIKKANEEKAKQKELDDYAASLGEEITLRTKGIEQINQVELDGLRDRLIKAGELSDEFRTERERKEKEAEDRLTEYKKQSEQQRLELSKAALTTLSDIVDAFAGKDEASQRKAFKIKKAAAIAQTTIETYQAAQSAYASQMAIPTPDAPIRAAVAATIAIASGLAKVKAIASQQFEGGGSASATGGGGAIPAPASSPAQFNIVGNSGTNQLMEGLSNSPVQAYVVAGEVTTAQSLDRNRISTATL